MASWEDSGDARKYEVRLYRNDNSVTSVLTTSDTSYDFSGYITKSGDYLFKVRAVYSSSDKGSWEESDSWYVSSEEADEISDGRRTYGSSHPVTKAPGSEIRWAGGTAMRIRAIR